MRGRGAEDENQIGDRSGRSLGPGWVSVGNMGSHWWLPKKPVVASNVYLVQISLKD